MCRLLFETDSSYPVSQSRTQSPLLAGIYVQREGKRMVHGMVIPPIFALLVDCKIVRIFAYSSTREQSNKAENRERDWGETLKLPTGV